MKFLISLVLIISVDTLRYDALEYMPVTSHYLEKFQQVEHCWTPVPLTLPAHVSMLTGKYPYEHGIRNNGNYRLNKNMVYLPQLLQEMEFNTAAFVSSKVLSAKYGLDRGFHQYSEPSPGIKEQPSEVTVKQCLEFLSKPCDNPRLVFLHLYDPHAPYKGYGKAIPNSHEAYYGEAAYVDEQLKKIWHYLDQNHLWQSSIIVFTSDHGEDLGDHGEFQHGLYLYDTTTRIPFFLYSAREIQLRKTGSLVDLTPTILDLFNIEKPMEMTGTSLLRTTARPCFLESLAPYELMRWSRMFGITYNGWKYIEGDLVELFKLDEQGEEKHYIKNKPDLIKQFRKMLEPMKKATINQPKGDPQLLALGYLSPAAEGEIRTIPRADQRKILETLHHCFLHMEHADFNKIWDISKEALTLDRDNPAIQFYLLTAAARLNRTLTSDVLNSIKPESDRSGSTAYMLGQYYETHGLRDKAEKYYKMSQQQNELFIEPSLSLMILALTSGRKKEAQHYVEVLRQYGLQEEAGILAEVVWRYYKGSPHYALIYLDKIQEMLAQSVRYWVIKGYIQSSMKKYKDAFGSFQKAHILGFMSPEFLLTWATIALETNNMEEARQLFVEFIERYPQHKETVNVKGILEDFSEY